eukprot:2888336-Rhodomonas_salina.2
MAFVLGSCTRTAFCTGVAFVLRRAIVPRRARFCTETRNRAFVLTVIGVSSCPTFLAYVSWLPIFAVEEIAFW